MNFDTSRRAALERREAHEQCFSRLTRIDDLLTERLHLIICDRL